MKLGDTIQLRNGRLVNPLNLSSEDIFIGDIITSLSNTCRFRGHCSQYYSVAQHSVIVASVVDDLTKGNKMSMAWALLHDAAEAYLVDAPRPMKSSMYYGNEHVSIAFSVVEKGIMSIIAEKFKLPKKLPEEVAVADKMCLRAEAELLMGNPEWIKKYPEPPKWLTIRPMGPVASRLLFHDSFKTIMALDE